MKKIVVIILGLLVLIGLSVGLYMSTRKPLEYQISKLYAEPSQESNVVYQIPIEVTLVDVSDDANWYKVRISFKLGPLNYAYEGWTPIPIKKFVKEIEE